MNLSKMVRMAVSGSLAVGLVLMSMTPGFLARGAAPPPPWPSPPPRRTAPPARRPADPPRARPAPPDTTSPKPPRALTRRHLPPKPPKPVRVAARRRVVVHRSPTITVIESADQLVTVPAATSETASGTAYKVTRLADDYTPVLSMDNQEKKVRLIGVALPDLSGSASAQYQEMAERFFTDLLVGEFVYLAYDSSVEQTDEDGTPIAYLYRAPDGLLLNLEVVRQGLGLCETQYYFDQQESFEFYESKAQADNKGLWSLVEEAAPEPAPAVENTSDDAEGIRSNAEGARSEKDKDP